MEFLKVKLVETENRMVDIGSWIVGNWGHVV